MSTYYHFISTLDEKNAQYLYDAKLRTQYDDFSGTESP